MRNQTEKEKQYSKQYREKNRDILIEKSRKWRKENPEKSKQCIKNWMEKNIEKYKKTQKEYREKHREKLNQNLKIYHQNNMEREKEYRKKNREKLLKTSKEHYKKNRDCYIQYRLNYYPYRKILNSESKCELCDTNRDLMVHHIDKNHQNDERNNLKIVCRGCHAKIHIKDLSYVQGRLISPITLLCVTAK